MESRPLISVIIPVYNVEPYLRKGLDSVCGQTYGNLEIICVDDGSTDGSPAILREYEARDSRVRVLAQANAGVAAARNAALDVATGEWVVGMDPDDWLEPRAYETVVAQADEDVDLIFFGTLVEAEEGSGLQAKACALQRNFESDLSGRFAMTEDLFMGANCSIWNKFFRRSTIEENSLRFVPEIWCSSDDCFFMQFCLHAKTACFVRDRLYHYQLRGGSITFSCASRTNDKRCEANITCMREIYRHYDERGKVDGYPKHLSNQLLNRYGRLMAYAAATEKRQRWSDEFLNMVGECGMDAHPGLAGTLSSIREFSRWGDFLAHWLESCRERAVDVPDLGEACHVAVVADETLAVPAIVMMQGVKETAGKPVHAHFICGGVSASMRRRMERMTAPGFAVTIHEVDDELFSQFPPSGPDGERVGFLAMSLPDILPSVKRILLLDAWCVVEEDVTPLAIRELGGCLMVAATDVAEEACLRLQLERYAATRFLVMDLERMREEGSGWTWMLETRMCRYPLRHPFEDSLNLCFGERICYLTELPRFRYVFRGWRLPATWLRRRAASPATDVPLADLGCGEKTPCRPFRLGEGCSEAPVLGVLPWKYWRTLFKKALYSLKIGLSTGRRRKKYVDKKSRCAAEIREMRRQVREYREAMKSS